MNFIFKLSLIPSSVGGIILIYKTYFGVPMYNGDEDLKGKVAIVTGASSGIGKEIAYQLAKKNATVIMACRNNIDCKQVRMKIFNKTKNSNIFCSELDLSSLDSVRQFVGRVSKKMPSIDILVHNSGVKSGVLRKISNDHIEEQMAVNSMSPYLLNKLLLPSLVRNARVVTLVCPEYSKGSINIQDPNYEANYDNKKAFAQSQLMRIVLATNPICAALRPDIVYVTCDPGPTSSGFNRNEAYNNNFVSRTIFRSLNFFILRNMWQAAATPIMCCCSSSLEPGGHYKDLVNVPLDAIALDKHTATYADLLCDKWTKRFVTTPNDQRVLTQSRS